MIEVEPMQVYINSDDSELDMVEPATSTVTTTEESMQRARKLMAEGQSPYATAQQLVQNMVSTEEAVQILAELLTARPVDAGA
eukprot:8205779-Lingulodinium_polyedra.AAC.1